MGKDVGKQVPIRKISACTDPSVATNSASGGGSAVMTTVTTISKLMAREVRVKVEKVIVEVEMAWTDNIEYVICTSTENTAEFPKEESNENRKVP